ncbi:DUF29 domain-containing protein [Cronbergia sp. UHCC 0137]|uniref:DUF29 domain-containing protein n=1 Tax=Cronbergia sp. UHCC 0137 TaxID=3110239 RepID=UPI002B21ACEC|nr:DUF29 domain-containing protein [Cronbergia sp. UHCC 0137]MEA5620396.1 DUF29 domain-containing protein [Cronbergia sp. UHCC 0137]
MKQIELKQTLYEQDLNAWFDDTLIKLKAGQFDAIDMVSLIEEIEGLAGRDKREVKSRLIVLFAHLLKRIYLNSAENNRGWELTIREQRRELELLLQQSPSLKNHLNESFSSAWKTALSEVREEYPQIQFPEQWEFTNNIEALLNQSFWNLKNYD